MDWLINSMDLILYDQILEKGGVLYFLEGLNKELDEVWGQIICIKSLPSLK
uniref:Uncharacterized protein n=1 Tax=Cajanus cajan TaxID=3821 RepID=A0A151TWH2_CAJCA|nr:hypothetical protein KK1_010627 [Cajanus cajan]